MNDDFLKSRLRRVVRRYQWLALWRKLAACWAAAALAGVTVSWVQGRLGNVSPLTLPVLLAVALAAAVVIVVFHFLKAPDLRWIARKIENRHPELNGLLLTAVQQQVEGGQPTGYLQYRVLQEATARSLILLDELGSATDPEEAGALAVAIVDRFREAGSLTLASTHHTALKAYAANTPGVVSANMGFDEDTLAPTYHLTCGVDSVFAVVEDRWAEIGLDGVERAAQPLVGIDDPTVADLMVMTAGDGTHQPALVVQLGIDTVADLTSYPDRWRVAVFAGADRPPLIHEARMSRPPPDQVGAVPQVVVLPGGRVVVVAPVEDATLLVAE